MTKVPKSFWVMMIAFAYLVILLVAHEVYYVVLGGPKYLNNWQAWSAVVGGITTYVAMVAWIGAEANAR